MASIFEGKTLGFVVVGKSASGRVVPLTDATVVVADGAVASAVVNADGSNGLVSGVAPGDTTLVATAAGVSSAPFPITVLADNVVVSVEIQTVDSVNIEPL